MRRLSRLYNYLDINRMPGCSKDFLKNVFRKDGELTLPPENLENGTDSRPLLEHGLIQQCTRGKVSLTKKARKMMD